MTVCGVSRETGIAEYGVVITGVLDDDSLSCGGWAGGAPRASRPTLAVVMSMREPGYAWLSGEVPHADVEVVGW